MSPSADSDGVTRPEALRVWLLGGFRVSVGSGASRRASGDSRKQQASSSCLSWRRIIGCTGTRLWNCYGKTLSLCSVF